MQTWRCARAGGNVLALTLLSLFFGACAGEAPPFDELPLRDALGADPEVIAALPREAERGLADRFESTRKRQSEAEEMQPDGRGTPAAEVRDADVAREARGEDALVTAIFSPEAGSVVVRPRRLEEAAASRALPPLSGQPPSSSTPEAQAQALAGRARAGGAGPVARGRAGRGGRGAGGGGGGGGGGGARRCRGRRRHGVRQRLLAGRPLRARRQGHHRRSSARAAARERPGDAAALGEGQPLRDLHLGRGLHARR